MVTISNFERYVLPKILARGEDYYDSGAVLGIEEESPGEWFATVCGTEHYEVTVLTMEIFVSMWWLRFWQFVIIEAKPTVFCLLKKWMLE